jgi:hypothetical protein
MPHAGSWYAEDRVPQQSCQLSSVPFPVGQKCCIASPHRDQKGCAPPDEVGTAAADKLVTTSQIEKMSQKKYVQVCSVCVCVWMHCVVMCVQVCTCASVLCECADTSVDVCT